MKKITKKLVQNLETGNRDTWTTYCKDLLKSYDKKMSINSEDPKRNRPLTPNDSATIATLASYILDLLSAI